MTDKNLSQFPAEDLVKTFSRIADESKGDVSVMFEKLNIPVELQGAHTDELKKRLERIASGDKQEIQEFVQALKTALEEKEIAGLKAAKGGVTKLKLCS